jgi:hypothetical protein
MNRFWIVAAVLLVALIGFIYSQERMMGCDTFEPGGTLSLVRTNGATVRARFCYAAEGRSMPVQSPYSLRGQAASGQVVLRDEYGNRYDSRGNRIK